MNSGFFFFFIPSVFCLFCTNNDSCYNTSVIWIFSKLLTKALSILRICPHSDSRRSWSLQANPHIGRCSLISLHPFSKTFTVSFVILSVFLIFIHITFSRLFFHFFRQMYSSSFHSAGNGLTVQPLTTAILCLRGNVWNILSLSITAFIWAFACFVWYGGSQYTAEVALTECYSSQSHFLLIVKKNL